MKDDNNDGLATNYFQADQKTMVIIKKNAIHFRFFFFVSLSPKCLFVVVVTIP